MKNRKKISILYGLEAAGGGALKHLTYLVTHLDKELFDITVILSPNRPDRIDSEIDKLKQSGARIMELSMKREFSLFLDLRLVYRIYRHLRRHRYDIIHAHSSKAGFTFRVAAWLSGGASVVYTPHCFYFQGKKGISRWFYSRVEKWLGRITSYLVVSNNERDYALQYGIAAEKKLVTINNAIDFIEYDSREQSGQIRAKLGIDEKSIIIGSVGRLTEQKDLVTYIYAAREVLKEHRNVVFLIAGDGELKDELQKLIEELRLQDKVLIIGHYSNISDIYAVIDIFVSTSLWEGMPYVILEAMWFKKPVVASDLGYRGLLHDKENGFLVKAGDYTGFAEIIKVLLRNNNLIREMGEKGHSLVNTHFNFANFIRDHELFYKKLTDKRPPITDNREDAKTRRSTKTNS
jgi:glycosyltransferase involved in cell wall biosynthesis